MNDHNKFIEANKWKYAYTFAKFAPHWYLVRSKVKDKKAFDAFVKYINENGSEELWNNRTFTYLYLDKHKYWVMGGKEVIINRAIWQKE